MQKGIRITKVQSESDFEVRFYGESAWMSAHHDDISFEKAIRYVHFDPQPSNLPKNVRVHCQIQILNPPSQLKSEIPKFPNIGFQIELWKIASDVEMRWCKEPLEILKKGTTVALNTGYVLFVCILL